MSTRMILWHNGQLIQNHLAQNNANSAGNLLGWGVFTTIGIWNGRAFALPQHLQRLRNNAQKTRIEISYSDIELAIALDKVLKANRIARGMARITHTRRGDGRWNQDISSDALILAQPLIPSNTPLRVCLSPHFVEAQRPLRGVKSTSHLEYQIAWLEAHEQGFDETILRNSEDFLCEGARSNIFWVKDEKLFTPSLHTGCLPGIAREIVLDGARNLGICVEEKFFRVAELYNADEVFLTSATQGPRAVCEVTDKGAHDFGYSFKYSQDAITRQLIQFWEEKVRSETQKN